MESSGKNFVNGVDQVELAVIDEITGVPGTWVNMENITMTTVVYTSNSDNKTNIFAEDKPVAIAVLTDTGDPDTFAFSSMELSTANFSMLFNAEIDLLTSTTTVLAQRREANLAIRLTTKAIGGVKTIFTFLKTQAESKWAGNFTKSELMSINVTASILSFGKINGKDALYTIQKVRADGSVINSTPPTVSAGIDSTTTTATKALTGTATAASPKTVVQTLWTQVSGPNIATMTAPSALTNTVGGLITGAYVFQLSVTDSDGIVASASTKVTATIA